MQPLQPKVNTILNLVFVGLGKVVRNVSSTFSLCSTWPLYSVHIPVPPPLCSFSLQPYACSFLCILRLSFFTKIILIYQQSSTIDVCSNHKVGYTVVATRKQQM